MEGEKGVSIADAERIVESNLSQIIERFHETRQTTCTSAEVAAATTTSVKHCIFRAEILGPHEHDPLDVERTEDIGGDMNHIHRVTIQLLCSRHNNNGSDSSHMSVATVIVKTAPDEVLYLKKGCGEQVSVDQHKVEFEYLTFVKFNMIHPHSVPDVFVLDRANKTIIMEDLSQSGFTNLYKVLVSGDVDNHLTAIERALTFIGRVHSVTWLEGMETNERRTLINNHSNSAMRQLVAELLFDRPFNALERSNTCHPDLIDDVHEIRSNSEILGQLAKLKKAFLEQNDCLCHGDLATDNVMAAGDQFRIIDLEFSGVGLRAYDLALFLEMTIFCLLSSVHSGQLSRSTSLYKVVEIATAGYEVGMGKERAREPRFVHQTCGLIALELMWMVFGSYNIVEFGGDPGPERVMLSLARDLLLKVDTGQTIAWNITQQLSLHNLPSSTLFHDPVASSLTTPC